MFALSGGFERWNPSNPTYFSTLHPLRPGWQNASMADMKKSFALLALLSLALLMSVTAFAQQYKDTTTDEAVKLTSKSLYDTSGRKNGTQEWIASTKDETICVYFNVDDATNVKGNMPHHMELAPNSGDVFVAEYDVVNMSAYWHTNFLFKWWHGACRQFSSYPPGYQW